MGEYESKNKVNRNRIPDTGNYAGRHEAGKHAKPGCIVLVLFVLGLAAGLLYFV